MRINSLEDINLEFRYENYRPVSTNDMYIPTTSYKKGSKRPHSYLRKSGKLVELQKLITKSFEDEVFYSKEYISEVAQFIRDNLVGIKLSLLIMIPESEYQTSKTHKLLRNDVSNFIKSIEDAICSNIGYDDTYNVSVNATKVRSTIDRWRIVVQLSGYTYIGGDKDTMLEYQYLDHLNKEYLDLSKYLTSEGSDDSNE